jgi:hypothetical protein
MPQKVRAVCSKRVLRRVAKHLHDRQVVRMATSELSSRTTVSERTSNNSAGDLQCLGVRHGSNRKDDRAHGVDACDAQARAMVLVRRIFCAG